MNRLSAFPSRSSLHSICSVSARILILSISVSLLPSCKGPPPKLQLDPTFTPESLRAGRLGVGGLVSLVPGAADSLIASGRFEELLGKAIRFKGGLDLRSAVRTRQALGDALYDNLLESYKLTGTVQPEDLSGLDSSFCRSTRYLIFGRVEGNTVLRSSGLNAIDGELREWYQNRRLVVVSFAVVDAATGAKMCGAVYSGAETNVRKFKVKEEYQNGILDGAMARLLEEEVPATDRKIAAIPRFQEPPDFEPALVPAVDEFTKHLPLKK